MIHFVDIHTHTLAESPDVISIYNCRLGKESIPDYPYISVGIHPWDIQSENQITQLLIELDTIVAEKNICAFGECGLDKSIPIDFSLQSTVFQRQIAIAQTYKKPIVIHCVKSYNEVIQILKSSKIKVPILFHKYSGSEQLTKELMQFNSFFSISNVSEHVLQYVPLHRLFLETDDSTSSIIEKYSIVCRLLSINQNELQQRLYQNFKNFIGNSENSQ